jgi:hypothetical protein
MLDIRIRVVVDSSSRVEAFLKARSEVMNGNKPLATFSSAFTHRLAGHPRIAYWPHPKCPALVAMVIDEILVGADAAGSAAAGYLNGIAENVGHVFPKSKKNVEIWRLKQTPGNKPWPDVADAVWNARKLVPNILARQISPNHILVPASNYHTCPWGPPDEPPHLGAYLGSATEKIRVTVIDSGYIESSTIDGRLESATYGEWFGFTQAGGYGWVAEQPPIIKPGGNVYDQNDDGYIDALAGHANFVAGIVAQACPEVLIRVKSHNGAFVTADAGDPVDTPLPTEASVARSLWETLADSHGWSDVINIGFAFPTLPWAPPVGVPPAGPPSWTFKAVFDEYQNQAKRFTVVAPAGNQHCIVPQYPAAFHQSYSNVIGVASIDSYGSLSIFSNFGSWVACAAEGEHVVSTFLEYSGTTEELEIYGPLHGTHQHKDFRGWASWSGTCFAAPKVTGALAQARVDGKTLDQGWYDLVNKPGTTSTSSTGYKLMNLRPD